jgi:hypothetical protein
LVLPHILPLEVNSKQNFIGDPSKIDYHPGHADEKKIV